MFNYFKIKKKLKKIKLIVLDVDGVLTNGELIYNDYGQIQKKFNVKDGLAIKILIKLGYKIVFLSGGTGEATIKRANDLGVKYCYTEILNKYHILNDLQNVLKIDKISTLYIGDDINDIQVLQNINLLVVPKDGNNIIKGKADIVLNKKGGEGVIGELLEIIITKKKLIKFIDNERFNLTN